MTSNNSESLPPESIGKARRSVKNYVLQPFLQVRFGLYTALMSILFAILLCVVLYIKLGRFVEIVLELTGVEDEVKDLLIQYAEPAKYQILALLIVYVAGTLALSIKFTHGMVGPTVAFRRHIHMIKQGNYEHRTTLRDGDAFQEVAKELNELSETFQNQEKSLEKKMEA